MRHLVSVAESGLSLSAARKSAAASIDTMVAKMRSKPPIGKQSIDRTLRETKEMVKSGFDRARASNLVALYYLCHTDIYGSAPIELVGNEWKLACIAAANMLRWSFGSDINEAVEFIRWTWSRERWREEHLGNNRSDDNNGGNRWRISWRYQFQKKNLLSDYLANKARRARASKRH